MTIQKKPLKHVAIVDYNPNNQAMIAAILATLPQVSLAHTYTTAKEAFTGLRKHKIDLFLIEYRLPEMNGTRLITHLRELPAYAAVPIIMLSTAADLAIKQDALEKGADLFIERPFQIAELTAGIKALLSLR